MKNWLRVVLFLCLVFAVCIAAISCDSSDGPDTATTPGGKTDTTVTEPGGSADNGSATTPGGSTDNDPATTPGGSTDNDPATTSGGKTDTTVTEPEGATDDSPATTPGGNADNPGTEPAETTVEGETSGTPGDHSSLEDEFAEALKIGKKIDSADIVKRVKELIGVTISLPKGSDCTGVEIVTEIGEGNDETVIGVLASDTSVTAREYFDTVKAAFGADWAINESEKEGSYSLGRMVIGSGEYDEYYSFTVSFENSTDKTFAFTAAYYKESGSGLVTSTQEFAKNFKSFAGVEPKLPSDWLAVLDGEGDNRNGTKTYEALVSVSDLTADKYRGYIDVITPSLNGFTKGELEVEKGGDETVYMQKWTNANGDYFYLELDDSDSYSLLSFGYVYKDYSSSAKLPVKDINAYFKGNHNIPEYTGFIGEVNARTTYDDSIAYEVSEVNDDEFNAYLADLVKAGWEVYPTSDGDKKYVQADGDTFATITVIEDWIFSSTYTLTFNYEALPSPHWPADLVKAAIGDTAAAKVPAFDGCDGLFYEILSTSDNNIRIRVTGNVSQKAADDYVSGLGSNGFVAKSDYLVYTFPNNDEVSVDAYYSEASYGDPTCVILDYSIKRYEGNGFNLPENIALKQSVSGGGTVVSSIFAKIGKNYQYVIYYEDGRTVSNVIVTFNAADNSYSYMEGQVDYSGAFVWKDAVTKTQKQIDEWIQSTLNYADVKPSALKNYTKEANKVQYLGISCDKYTYQSYYGKAYVIVDPETNIPLCQGVEMNGAAQDSYAYVSYDKSVRSFADAHIPACLGYRYNPATGNNADHVFGAVQEMPATCSTDGGRFESCVYCGYRHYIEQIPATGRHNCGDYWYYDEDLNQHYQWCYDCEQYVNYGTCTYGEWQVYSENTCADEGERYRYCTKCGHEEYEITPADPSKHCYSYYEWSRDDSVKPTATKSGKIVWHCDYDWDHAVLEIAVPALNSSAYKTVKVEEWSDEADGDVMVTYYVLNSPDSLLSALRNQFTFEYGEEPNMETFCEYGDDFDWDNGYLMFRK